ncbi:hypothetical protein B0F90DRAFT_1946470 [Multifurca ochricompacta]|uniref:Late embryogenesis abundant protein LEA-2 subgroup domain-containing protein n=1 Tax=Multifurca ochricompacta TaxID=376703 RepID=A0AAD4M9L9_9AGAM|nr:hypothetical protein B0F90DRAFT_1946470 [Multifurca ochricompacta]
MPPYNPGESNQYYGDNQQHETFQDPSQFDPYYTHRPLERFDQSGYREPYKDEPNHSLQQGQSTEPLGAKGDPSFYADESNATRRMSGSARNLRTWRYQQGHNLWTRGSGPRCFCRFFCCTVLVTLLLVISIILCLALVRQPRGFFPQSWLHFYFQWIQPPDVIIGGGNVTSTVVTQSVNVLNNGIQVNLGLPVQYVFVVLRAWVTSYACACRVVNPNYFSAKLTHVKADIFYPINNTIVGNGTLNNVNLPSRSTTKFTFPFSLDYTDTVDPNLSIITDIAERCLGSPQRDLSISYKLTVGVKVFFITVSPTISNKVSFTCPISSSDLEVRLLIISSLSPRLTIFFSLEQNLAKEIGLDLGKIIGSGSGSGS